MDLRRCNNGHFYDGDTYAYCPHCEGGGSPNRAGAAEIGDLGQTIALDSLFDYDQDISSNSTTDLGEIIDGITEPLDDNDQDKTVGYFESKVGEPVVGWLVCVEGNHFGEDFRLKAGKNFIGRSNNMDVCLSGDNSVSRDRHLIVLYDPNNNIFIVQSGESKELSYHNQELVLSPAELKPYDVLQVGTNKLLFIPFCSDEFTWKIVEDQPNDK